MPRPLAHSDPSHVITLSHTSNFQGSPHYTLRLSTVPKLYERMRKLDATFRYDNQSRTPDANGHTGTWYIPTQSLPTAASINALVANLYTFYPGHSITRLNLPTLPTPTTHTNGAHDTTTAETASEPFTLVPTPDTTVLPVRSPSEPTANTTSADIEALTTLISELAVTLSAKLQNEATYRLDADASISSSLVRVRESVNTSISDLSARVNRAAQDVRLANDETARLRTTVQQTTIEHAALLQNHSNAIATLQANQPTVITIVTNNGASPSSSSVEVSLDSAHKQFPLLARAFASLAPTRRNGMLIGPAGSGKSYSAKQLADLLGVPYFEMGACVFPSDLMGHHDLAGNFITKPFKEAFTHGGLLLLDELDSYQAPALLALNGALANGRCTFPDSPISVNRHPNFYALGGGNTFGSGPDAKYVGRTKLDAAFLDRFFTLYWQYDESLEAKMLGLSYQPPTSSTNTFTLTAPQKKATPACAQSFLNAVQAVRAKVANSTANYVISPRSSQFGVDFCRADQFTRDEVVNLVFAKYRTQPMWGELGEPVEQWVKGGN